MRAIQCVIAIVFSALAAGSVQAQGPWPSKPIRVVSPFPPGTPGDFIIRLLGDPLGTALGQPLVVENRPGAGGNIGVEAVAKSAPDGYTLLVTVDTVVTVNPHIYPKLPFAVSDLTPVTYLTDEQQALVCNPSVGVKSLADLIQRAKSSRMNYASGGYGVPGHLAMELLISLAGITTMNHVPYKGPGPAMQDVLAGQVPCGFLASAVVLPHVKSGKLVGLGVSGGAQSAVLPELPTIAQAGLPGYDATFGEMMFAPSGTPEPIVRRLRDEIVKTFSDRKIVERLRASDLIPVGNTPAEAQARIARESERWQKVVKRINLRIE